MSLNGGYRILDLNDFDIHTNDDNYINDLKEQLYDVIKYSKRKTFLLSGIVIDGVEKADAMVTFIYRKYVDTSDSTIEEYYCKLYGKYLEIRIEDGATYIMYSENLTGTTGV